MTQKIIRTVVLLLITVPLWGQRTGVREEVMANPMKAFGTTSPPPPPGSIT